MSSVINQSQKYEEYLERLVRDVQQLDSDFRNFIKLWGLRNEYHSTLNEAPGFFSAVFNSFLTSTVIHAFRLFDHNSVGIQELIRIAKIHGDSITWADRFSDDDLDKQLQKINALKKGSKPGETKELLYRLAKLRNKVYAHLDKRNILDTESLANEIAIGKQEVRQAIDLAQEFLHLHYKAFRGVHLEMDIKGAVKAKYVLELLRIGRKYRDEDAKSRGL